jgi:hypothetical protein
VNRPLSQKPLFVSSLVALTLLIAPAAFAADPKDDKTADKPKDEPGAPTPAAESPAVTAPAPDSGASSGASGTAAVEANAGASGGSTGGAAVAEASLENPEETAPGAVRCGAELIDAGDHPEYRDRRCYVTKLESPSVYLYGGLEQDTGYAVYTYRDDKLAPKETLYDLRGRFVVGPMLHHEFKNGMFVRATGQLVGWIREQSKDHYQINVDDVYGQVGGRIGGGHWDFMIGRFMTWRVFHKGLGFDLYTLEDRGAAKSKGTGTDDGTYGVHTYEANYIYLRNSGPPIANETAGRAALHYFPTRYLGAELAGVYGQVEGGTFNTIGGRLAVDFHKKLGPLGVRVSAAGEDRFQTPTAYFKNVTGTGPDGQPIYEHCADCLVSDHHGVAGGAVLKYSILEAGGDLGQAWSFVHKNSSNTTGAARDPAATGDTTSYGGYFQLDPGTLLFKRALILGAGVFKTTLHTRTSYVEQHIQGAAYIAFPLGFNDAMIKLIFSRAELDTYEKTSADGAPVTEYLHHEYAMTAARLRFAYYF